MANAALDLYDAFKASGMADAQARQATDALLRSHDHRLDDIERGQREGFGAQIERFETIDRQLEAFDQRFEKGEVRLDAVEQRLDRVEGRLDAIEQRLDRVEGRLDAIEGRLSLVERDTMLLKWMVGFNLTITVAVLAKLLFG